MEKSAEMIDKKGVGRGQLAHKGAKTHEKKRDKEKHSLHWGWGEWRGA